MLDDDEWERRYRERQRLYDEAEAHYRQEHIDLVVRALILKTSLDITGARVTAEVAIDALIDDGVVFARMGSCNTGGCE